MMQSGSSDDSSRSVKRGDIVWVRVHFPHKWRPALVLSSRDNLGVQVTFSFSQNDAVSPSPTFFVESEVVPFEDAFPSLISRRNLDAPPLHSALRLLGQRVLSGLRCHCITGHAQAQQQPAREFDTVGVLGFVLDAAVSPWVEPAHFAHAVRVVAQVHAFRSYCYVKHKKMYKQNKKAGDNVKLLPSSSLRKKVHKVTQESVALEPKEKYLIISKNGEKNIAIGDIKRLNSTVPLWEGNSARLFENQHLIISQNLVHSPALDPLYMLRESLKSVRQSLLGFKNISDQGIVDICFEDFSNMSRTHISVPSNFMIHLRNYIDKRKDNALGLCWRLPDKETITYLNRRKRRRLNKSASCNDFPQISEVQESERDADISKHTTPCISDIKMLEPEGSIQKDHQASTCVCETSMNFTEEVQKVDSKRSQSFESLSNLVHRFHSDKSAVDASEAKVKGMLGSDSSVYQERLQMSCNCDTTPLKSKRSAKYILKLTRPKISYIRMLEQEGSIQKHHQASTCICETSMNFTDEVQKADSKRSQTCEPVSNLVHPFHSDKCEVDANAAKVKGTLLTLESDSSVYQERLQMSCDSVTTPLKSKRSARTEISSGDCLVEGKDCYEGVASCSIFNSNVGQLSKTHVPFFPKALLMKFPKNFDLPSKEQLVKKFSVFDSVDSYRTRVFCYAGSAQVSFLQEADAVAAFKYAKKKALFGKANVRFWLDPFDHKRRGFNPSSKQTGPPLKSCLKNSNSFSKENRKKHRRVRFTISAPLLPSTSNQTGPPLKSCLKNSNSLSKENRKKHLRVRFTIET